MIHLLPFPAVKSPPSPSFGPAGLFHAFYDTARVKNHLRSDNAQILSDKSTNRLEENN